MPVETGRIEEVVTRLANSCNVIDVTFAGVGASYRFSKPRAMSAKKKNRTTPGAERYRCESSNEVLFEGLQLYFEACARDCEDTPKPWIDIKFARSPEVETKGQDDQIVDNGRCVAKRWCCLPNPPPVRQLSVQRISEPCADALM